MLKKQNRLARITGKSRGNVYSSPFFNIKVYEGQEEVTRFGFVVSKKISTKAVVRNRTKRVLRAAAQNLVQRVNPEKDIIVFSKKELDFKQEKEVLRSMTEIFTKAKII